MSETCEQTRVAEIVFGGGDHFFDLERCSLYLAGLDGASIDDCPLHDAAWVAAQTAARRPVTVLYSEEQGRRSFKGLHFRHHEQALSRLANRILFCDTDVLTTAIWSDWMFQQVPEPLEALIQKQNYDLYLLTDVDVPWVEDPVRYLPDQRQAFFKRCREELIRRSHHFVHVHGGWEERFRLARQAVDTLLN